MMKQAFLIGSCCVVLSSCGEKGENKAPSEKRTVAAYRQLVAALGDQNLNREQRNTAFKMLLKADEDVIPVLLEALTDERVYDPAYIAPNSDNRAMPEKRTVGFAVSDIFYCIVNPSGNGAFHVDDWRKFWEENKGKHFIEIQAIIREKYDSKNDNSQIVR